MTVVLTLTAPFDLRADDWCGFHGLEKEGRCDSTTGPVNWSPSQNVAWKTAIPGRGHSSPIVCGDRIYLTTTYEAAPLSLRIWSYTIFVLTFLFTLAGIGLTFQSLRQKAGNTNKAWPHVRLFLFTLFSVGIIVVALFGRNLLSLEGNATRCWLATIIVMLSCLALSSFFVPLKSRQHLVAGLLSLAFVVPTFLALEHKELILAPKSAKGFIITAALGCPLVFALAFFACYLFGSKYQSERAHSEAQGRLNLPVKRHVLLTANLGLAAALLPFMLLIYRAAGYQMPNRHIWGDRVKPDVSWWIIGLYLSVVLITIGCCWWKSIRNERVIRFASQKLFFVVAVLLGIAFFVRSGSLNEKEFIHTVVCVSRDSSRVLWSCEGLAGRTELQNSRTVTHASATPVTDGEHIFGYFGEDGLICVSVDGILLWKRTEPLFDGKYGAATSPVLKDNILVIASNVTESAALPSSIIAFDSISGLPLWKKLRKSHKDFATYGTPLVRAVDGRQVAVVQGWYDIKGYDLRTGQELWSYPLIHEGNHLVASLASDSRCLYVMGARKISALDLSRLGTCNDPLLWTAPISGEKSSTPVVVNGFMFLVTETGMAYCLEAQTGEVLWKNRLSGRYYSSVITMGDKVLFTNESGLTTVVAIDKDFRELAGNALREPVYASLAPAGNQLFIRTDRHLYCVQESR